MNKLPPVLVRIGRMLAALRHPAPSILLPGTLALALWLALPLMAPGIGPAWQFTVAFAASYGALIARRCWMQMRSGNPALQSTASWLFVGGLIVLATGVLLSQHSIGFSQHFVSIHLAVVAGLHLMQVTGVDDNDPRPLSSQVRAPSLHTTVAIGTVLLALSTLVLNEMLITVLTPGDWLIVWALCPVLLHYLHVMMVQVAYLTTRPNDGGA